MATKPKKRVGKDGKPRWRVQVYLGRHPDTGKHLFRSRSFATKREAKAWARDLEKQRDDGYQPTATKITFGDYLRDTWLPTYRTQVRSTYNIEKTLGKWVLRPRPDTPYLGGIRLHKLTVGHFDKLYVAMGAQGMRARGIAYLHGLLKRALKAAVRKGELPRNPAEFATLPKPDVKAEITDEADEDASVVRVLTQEQAARFLTAARKDRHSALWHVLLTGGLRPGEALALKWRHVDFTLNLVRVRATLHRVRGKKNGDSATRGWKLTRPKTSTSRRDVPLPEITMRELRRWKKQQAAERLRMGSEWQDHGFVFTTQRGTPLGNNVRRSWKRLLAGADGGRGDLGKWGEQPAKPRSGPTARRPFTPKFPLYLLRHTSATLALLNGVELLEVSRRLGHKDLAFTARTYGHVKAEHSTKSAAAFDAMFGT